MQSSPKTTFVQRRRLINKLRVYSAGVMAALAADRELPAAIVFTNFEASPISIDGGIFHLDLNHDGDFDFELMQEFRRVVWTDSSGHSASARTNEALIRGVRQNTVLGSPLKLPAGALIDPMASNQAEQAILAHSTFVCSWSGCDTFSYGSFKLDDSRGYLGVQFSFQDGGRHSAWIKVDAWSQEMILFGFAYETEPGMPILAGDTGISPNVPGDTNGDGQVDLEDVNNVRNNFGASGVGIPGDTNGDDLVDLEDLNAVRNNFGAGNSVPEPPSLVLLAAGAAGLAILRQKRAKHAQS